MADYWNLTNFTEANSIYEIIEATNQSSGGIYGGMALLSFFVILFMRSSDVCDTLIEHFIFI